MSLFRVVALVDAIVLQCHAAVAVQAIELFDERGGVLAGQPQGTDRSVVAINDRIARFGSAITAAHGSLGLIFLAAIRLAWMRKPQPLVDPIVGRQSGLVATQV